jgi:hypothetical protein
MKASKRCFFEKKAPRLGKQKPFALHPQAMSPARSKVNKVFFASFLFTKKKSLLPFLSFPA